MSGSRLFPSSTAWIPHTSHQCQLTGRPRAGPLGPAFIRGRKPKLGVRVWTASSQMETDHNTDLSNMIFQAPQSLFLSSAARNFEPESARSILQFTSGSLRRQSDGLCGLPNIVPVILGLESRPK
ncbi:hypothetical protein DPEC_G00339160 [Dallia pectoralis]|uniref:Uncharacterized protein n=1 Tax=Dallia pectoralis TaxID=75939 RepID=A0ACC2F4R3_DALPE|nr:hypothetical protein DPEC_G00339160 [Dallia pectoralis]